MLVSDIHILKADFLRGSFSGVLVIFLVVEYVRYFDFFSQKQLFEWMQNFTDERDQGTFVVTHIYLLLGCSLPLLVRKDLSLFELSSGLFNLDLLSQITLAGTILLGVGDSFASFFGTLYGSHKWQSESEKSIEGTVAGFCGVFLCLALYGSSSCDLSLRCRPDQRSSGACNLVLNGD